MSKIEVVAKNVEKAIAEGLKQLGLTQDEVDIRIIEEGGLFKKAKVELSYEGKEKTESAEVVKEEVKKDKKQDKKQAKQEVKESKQEDKKPQTTQKADGDIEKCGKDFLKGLFEKLNVTAEVEVVKNQDGTSFNISGEKINDLIGYRGETLNAIQYILSIVVKNANANAGKIFVDVEDYKKRREQSLINLGQRLAAKCIKIQKPVRLEPMTAYERRIIHAALSENEQVYTKSEGEEPRRYLVIIPKK